ncbi:GGDEF domain-containing protein [Sphingomonas parva]|uniref:GGDEF domain-containing protein n=1 Tax=Sphingomonas parva TaxID=2555898 RepID=A0A4Y8ZST1_9SPHN|nr:diguanylate cyclase [Sphingomonas parva]TFI58175.1 GGDEF domain-containing protein [Sphingomonas parva]
MPAAGFFTHFGGDGRWQPPALGQHRGLQLAFLLLLAATFAAVAGEDRLLERQQILYAKGMAAGIVRPHSDQLLGGSSTMRARGSGWVCTLGGRTRFPFCGLELDLADDDRSGFDLSRAERILVDYSYRGPAESLRLNLRNFDPRYSRVEVPGSTKYNTLELRVGQGPARADLAMANFAVAGWWLTEQKVPPELGRTEFGNIVALQLLTGNGAPLGSHQFELHGVTVEGRLMTQAEFYLLLLGLWGAGLAAYLLFRVAAASRALRREVLARQRAEEHAQALARHDALTGFLNRHAFREELSATLAAAAAAEQRGAVFLIEIGNLRSVNDVYGHAAGDALLVESARRLQASCPEGAIAGRMGGNELAFYVPGEQAGGEGQTVELTARLNQGFACSGSTLSPGATIGAACFPHHGNDYASLFRAADIALHEAKRAGGGSYRFYNSDLEGGASERIARMRSRERVLKASEERPAFLARARTDLVVREGCSLAAGWPAETMLCLTLTAAEWQEDWTAERIVTQLDMSGLDRARLTVELSETQFLSRAGATMRNLRALQDAGIRLALSGFRNGFNPAASSIRFDEIRPDLAFLSGAFGGGERRLFDRRG